MRESDSKWGTGGGSGGGTSTTRREIGGGVCGGGGGKAVIGMICGTLVYYHCAYMNSSIVSLFSDVFIVLLCSLAILGLLFRHINISAPVDPLDWQISQDTANCIFARLANTVGAAESVLRVAATGHDKRLFVKVVVSLYLLSALGRMVSGVTLAYAGPYIAVKIATRWKFSLLLALVASNFKLNFLLIQMPNVCAFGAAYMESLPFFWSILAINPSFRPHPQDCACFVSTFLQRTHR